MVWALALIAAAVAALFAFGTREPADLTLPEGPALAPDEVAAHFAQVETEVPNRIEGVEKRVVWAREPGVVTPLSILYVHGFSATSEEIRPVPDRLAEALGANLVYTRLTGHGRGGAALAEATVADWMADMAEGLAAARAVGQRVILMGTSTGGTLVTAALAQPGGDKAVAGAILVSPNFRIKAPAAVLLTQPGARIWAPWVAGAERAFAPVNDAHAAYWTEAYPTVALLPMAALVKAVGALDLSRVTVPALFWFADADTVVSADATRDAAARWSGPVTLWSVEMGSGDDPAAHVVMGDILSPGQTAPAVAALRDWIEGV